MSNKGGAIMESFGALDDPLIGRCKRHEVTGHHHHRHTRLLRDAGTARGCIVTIDAMGCQQEIAQGILHHGADCVLAVKQNQGRLYDDVRDRDVRDLLEGAVESGFDTVPHDYSTTLNRGRGRIERRSRGIGVDRSS